MKSFNGWWFTDEERIDKNQWTSKLKVQETNPLWLRGEVEWYKSLSSLFNIPFNTFVDVGASYGLIARPVSKTWKKVYCFEPNPKVFECLQKNLSQSKNVELYNIGLSYKKQSKTLYINHSNSTHASFNQLNDPRLKPIIKIPVVALDSFKFTELNFLKIDAEGWEYKVLNGAQKTIEQHKPAIFIELSDEFYHIINLLQVMGYILVRAFKINNYFFIHESKVKDVNQLLMGRKI